MHNDQFIHEEYGRHAGHGRGRGGRRGHGRGGRRDGFYGDAEYGGRGWAAGQPAPSEGLLALRQAIFATASAARQFGFANDEERTAKAVELLNETRKGLYGLLAADEEQSSQAE